jgi:hydrogenase/urease accessory protein HupE
MIQRRLLLVLLSFAAAAPAAAHPGHGSPEFASSWIHYLVEPGHALTIAALAVSLFALLRRVRAPKQRRSTR